MPSFLDLLRNRLPKLLPSELNVAELGQLLSPRGHSLLLTQRRATLIVTRVRMFAFLFAILTPLWGVVDLMVFGYPLWLGLASCRLMACGAFVCLLLF
nr:GGDEF domain-containing protein [Pseudomonas sp.]